MGADWTNEGRQKLHHAKGLVPVHVSARECPGCPHYAPAINWCRQKLQEASGGCGARTVYVDYHSDSPDALGAARGSRKPSGD